MKSIGMITGVIAVVGLLIALFVSISGMGIAALLVYIFLFGIIVSNFLLEN